MDSRGEVEVTSARSPSLVELEPPSGQVTAGAEEEYRQSPVGSDWRERIRPAVSFLVVLTLLVLAIVFVLARGSVADPDIWWHLHNADYLIQHHALPRQDMYSFTVAGHPWINHEWLGELPYYFGWRALGLGGIDAVTLSVLSFIFMGLLYLTYRHSSHYKASVAACCYAVFLASVSFGPRTILFGYAYLVVLLIVLQRFRQKDSRVVWMIPALFCLWVNTHGSWLIGLILFSIITAAGFARGSWGAVSAEPWTASQRKKLLLVWVASVAALFVNPFGSRLVFYPFDLAFRQKLNIEHVAEWISVNFHDLRGKLVLVLLLVLVISALLRSCRWTLAELGLLAFALYSGLTYSRFLFLLGIVVAPILAKILDFVPRYRRAADTPVLNTFVILLMIGGPAIPGAGCVLSRGASAPGADAEFLSLGRIHQLEGSEPEDLPGQPCRHLRIQRRTPGLSGPVISYQVGAAAGEVPHSLCSIPSRRTSYVCARARSGMESPLPRQNQCSVGKDKGLFCRHRRPAEGHNCRNRKSAHRQKRKPVNRTPEADETWRGWAARNQDGSAPQA